MEQSIWTATEFWAAIVGALVGGVIAFGIQIIALHHASRRRKEEKGEKNKALAHSILFKTVKIHSNIYNLRCHIEERYTVGRESAEALEPWQFYLPLANLPGYVHYSNEEMAMMLEIKNDELFNKIINIDSINNSTIEIFRGLNSRRQDLTDHFSADGEEGVMTSLLPRHEYLRLRPKMLDINQLSEDARRWCEEEEKNTRDVLIELHKTFKEKMGIKNKLYFKSSVDSGVKNHI